MESGNPLTPSPARMKGLHPLNPGSFRVALNIDGKSTRINGEPDTPLLWVLRDTLGADIDSAMAGNHDLDTARPGLIHLRAQP